MSHRPQPSSWRPAPSVVWLPEPHAETAQDSSRIYVLDLSAEIPVILEQTSAVIWIAMMDRLAHPSAAHGEGVTAAQLAEDLATGAQLDPQDIQPDIERFLSELGADSVLIQVPSGVGRQA